MCIMTEYTTIEKELSKLKEGESLVAIQEEGSGYFLHIGDNTIGNTWAVTREEMIQLKDILNNKFKD